MQYELTNELCHNLRSTRRIIHYPEGAYAAELLRWELGEAVPVAMAKKSRFARLLNKPIIVQELARSGDGILRPGHVYHHVPWAERMIYRLGFADWCADGARDRFWAQTSTRGYSFVVQLNFTGQHDQVYKTKIDPEGQQYYTCFGHPVNTNPKGANTLAWARIDLDLETGEALIEEVQNDWLRDTTHDYKRYQKLEQDVRKKRIIFGHYTDHPVNAQTFCDYYEQCVRPHLKIWAEAMLYATLKVLVEELGIWKVWMHSFEGGNKLKRLEKDYRQPPRSLYGELPRKFCFEKTNTPPKFLVANVNKQMRRWLKSGDAQFWHLAF